MTIEEKRLQVKREIVKRMLAERDADRPEPSKSIGASGIQGALQGVTLNHADELEAGLYAVADVLQSKFGESDPTTLSEAYKKFLPMVRGDYKKAEDDNPWSYGVSNVAGGVATMAIPGANIAKIASVGGRVGAGAGLGAAAGAGASEANPFNSPSEAGAFARDVALGGALGLGGQALGEAAPAVVKTVQSIPSKLRNTAEQRAFKATAGGIAKAYKETTPAKRGTIGRELLDRGVVRFGSDADSILQRATEAKDEVGKEFSKLFQEIDGIDPKTVSGEDIAIRLFEYADKIDMPGNESQVQKLRGIADQYSKMGNFSLARAQEFKNNYKWSYGDHPSDMELGKQVKNEIKMAIGSAIEDGVARFSSVADDVPMASTGTGVVSDIPMPGSGGVVLKEAQAARPDYGEMYDALKRKYGPLKEAQTHSRVLSNREAANRDISLTDYISMVGGAAGAGPAGLAIGLANKLARERGNAALAVSADRIADILQKSPDVLGQFAVPLATAAKNGSAAIASTHAALLNDPGYRDTLGGHELAAQAKELDSVKRLLAHRQQTQKWKATPEGQRWSTELKASHPKTAQAIEAAVADLDPGETEVIIDDPAVIQARREEIDRDPTMTSTQKAGALSAINETKQVRMRVPPRAVAAAAPKSEPVGKSPEDLIRILGG